MLFRQQMDESNHKMVYLLTRQIGTVFNPLIQSTNKIYQALATQMGRIANFFAPPQPIYQQIPQIQNIPRIKILNLYKLSNSWFRDNNMLFSPMYYAWIMLRAPPMYSPARKCMFLRLLGCLLPFKMS